MGFQITMIMMLCFGAFSALLGGIRTAQARVEHNRRLKLVRAGRSLDEWRKELEMHEFYRQATERKFDRDIATAQSEGHGDDQVQNLKYQKQRQLDALQREVKKAEDALAGRVDGRSAPSPMIFVWWTVAGTALGFVVARMMLAIV